MKNDDDLRAIREGLVSRETELRDRIRRVQDDLSRREAPLPKDAPDAAVVIENDEILHAVDETARGEIQQIERALERLEAGTYGLCEQCGEAISADRLRAVPYAIHCRICAPDS
jgi:RNA polymerase-binding transcription factor DksA